MLALDTDMWQHPLHHPLSASTRPHLHKYVQSERCPVVEDYRPELPSASVPKP